MRSPPLAGQASLERGDCSHGAFCQAATSIRWREDEEMIVQGLLVAGPKGEDFLLTTEPYLKMNTHRLVVMQRFNGRWKHLKGMHEPACREALIGALVDFLVDICRVLNAPGTNRIAAVAPLPGRSRTRHASPKTPRSL